MKVLDARIDWHFGFGNRPTLQLFVDKIKRTSDLIFEQYGREFIAHDGGQVMAFSCDSPSVEIGNSDRTLENTPVVNSNGFGGHVFDIQTTYGPRRLHGPWLGNSNNYNRVLPFHLRCMECQIVQNSAAWLRGYMFVSAFVTIDFALKAANEFLPSSVQLRNHDGFVEPCRVDINNNIWRKKAWGPKYLECGTADKDLHANDWDFIRQTSELLPFRLVNGINFELPNASRVR